MTGPLEIVGDVAPVCEDGFCEIPGATAADTED
jgi:hypothetical protein